MNRSRILVTLVAAALTMLLLPSFGSADPPVGATNAGDQDATVEVAIGHASGVVTNVLEQVEPESTEVAQMMTRLDRWGGSFQGCLDGATPQERAMAASIEYSCACLATYLINMCAPLDSTTNDQVSACFTMNMPAVETAFTRCLAYGGLVNTF